MRNKASLSWLFPLLVAVLCLALPNSLQQSLRNLFSSSLASSFSSKKQELASHEKREMEGWFHDRVEAKKKTCEEAQRALSEIGKSQALVGDVIARPKNTFQSFLWINLGTNDNPKEGPAQIAKWSPVLSGNKLIGVVEYVTKTSSLVRLISDPELHVAVRSVRGLPEGKNALHAIMTLQQYVHNHDELFSKEEEKKVLDFLLEKCALHAADMKKSEHLAKGEIHGNLLSRHLEGTGFNYDFADHYGEARDLRSESLVRSGDVLETSGLDGIFPEGLQVATVTSVAPLEEGAFSYKLKARPAAEQLESLSSVIVLAPRIEEPLSLPSRADRVKQELSN